MDIGIIGAGNIGATAARIFAGAGHRVAISNSRGTETLRGLVSVIGENARAGTVEEVAGFGEVVLLAVPWSRREEGEAGPAAREAGLSSQGTATGRKEEPYSSLQWD